MTDGSRDLRSMLAGPTLTAGRALLGARIVREGAAGRRVGRIVEVEAYIGEDDQASHARFGRTRRNAVMYEGPGTAYVYLVYGMHDCLNIVTEPADRPAALLVRAVEPLEGIELMRRSRAARVAARTRVRPASSNPIAEAPSKRPADARLAAGPGLVCAVFEIDRGLTGADLLDPTADVHLEPRPLDEPPPEIVSGPRVGVGYAPEPWRSEPWRLAIAGHPSVSRPPLRPV